MKKRWYWIASALMLVGAVLFIGLGTVEMDLADATSGFDPSVLPYRIGSDLGLLMGVAGFVILAYVAGDDLWQRQQRKRDAYPGAWQPKNPGALRRNVMNRD